MSDPANPPIRIALCGQPNCGKSTMFNALTGASARVGNYPGITVERMEGRIRHEGQAFVVTDLPGTYALTSYSPEEVVARDVIVHERPDVVICMLDAMALERSLYLTVQLLELGVPVVLALNMMDSAKKAGLHIDSAKLAELLQVPVVECVARRGIGRDELLTAAGKLALERGGSWKPLTISYGAEMDQRLQEMTARIEEKKLLTADYPARWVAVKYMEEDEHILGLGQKACAESSLRCDSGKCLHEVLQEEVRVFARHTEKTLNTYPEAMVADYRYGFVSSVIKQGVVRRLSERGHDISDKVDAVLTQRFLGPLIMLGVLYGMFYATINLGAYPQGWVEEFFGLLSGLANEYMEPGLLLSLIDSGIIGGVGAVFGFAPLIMVMFLLLVFLEDLGYMARVAYMLDRVFRLFGLHGASVMPFIISGGIPGGCAVPGVMAARTLRSPRERLATVFCAPFMICGAKMPVFLLLAAAFFPGRAEKVMMLLTLGSWVAALLIAKLLRLTVLKGESTPFVMELPPYRLPTLYGVLIHTWERVWQYIKKAGTVIFVIAVLIWAAMTFPALPEAKVQEFAKQEEAIKAKFAAQADKDKLEEALQELANTQREAELRHSLAGQFGEGLETVTQYAGFNWRTNIALVGGFAAKEVIVSTLSTAYAMGEVDVDAAGEDTDAAAKEPEGGAQKAGAKKAEVSEEEAEAEAAARGAERFRERLRNAPEWSMPAVISTFLFILLYSPCFVTVVAMARESSWRWALFSTFGSLIGAFALSVIVYQVGMLFIR